MEQNRDRAPVGRKYRDVPVPSAIPIWAAAGVWILAALFFPMARWWQILLVALASAGVGFLLKAVLPKKTRRVEVPFVSGNTALDDVVAELDRVSDDIVRDAEAVRTARPSSALLMEEIAEGIAKIREEVIASPDDVPKLRRYINYYLPAAVKLTDKCAMLARHPDAGENAEKTAEAADEGLRSVLDATKRQYDALFADDVLDITSDVRVLEAMLGKDGLRERDTPAGEK
ncbi:MAG: 5-bromo-4-chloroindolyl phosphate hydrolysis family protein [Clostridia bacterium]|nr:5-bromo-4-chloroindolyl phosphate hydrolysis family protein [Clostridia bacterium]